MMMKTLPELIEEKGITYFILAAVMDQTISTLREKLLTKEWSLYDYLRIRVYFRLSDEETLYALMEPHEVPAWMLEQRQFPELVEVVQNRLERHGITAREFASAIGIKEEALRKRIRRRYWTRKDYRTLADRIGITITEAVRLLTDEEV